jgi:hypothetical protein
MGCVANSLASLFANKQTWRQCGQNNNAAENYFNFVASVSEFSYRDCIVSDSLWRQSFSASRRMIFPYFHSFPYFQVLSRSHGLRKWWDLFVVVRIYLRWHLFRQPYFVFAPR